MKNEKNQVKFSFFFFFSFLSDLPFSVTYHGGGGLGASEGLGLVHLVLVCKLRKEKGMEIERKEEKKEKRGKKKNTWDHNQPHKPLSSEK